MHGGAERQSWPWALRWRRGARGRACRNPDGYALARLANGVAIAVGDIISRSAFFSHARSFHEKDAKIMDACLGSA
ncbi:hypothetical protein DA2_1735 [Desulfovibrio sp. A2]|nr:hypothetical protein DA2_1735 [Desulfovibrio sp. A2]